MHRPIGRDSHRGRFGVLQIAARKRRASGLDVGGEADSDIAPSTPRGRLFCAQCRQVHVLDEQLHGFAQTAIFDDRAGTQLMWILPQQVATSDLQRIDVQTSRRLIQDAFDIKIREILAVSAVCVIRGLVGNHAAHAGAIGID